MTDLQNNIETRSMLPVGTILQGGKYRIDRYLSSGGFGNTYVATNTEFEEQVAIKEFFMRGISQRDGDSVTVSVSNETNVSQFVSQKEKFRKEARRLRKLHNNHIVSVHDLFEENGTAYYEMDLIKGESLSERMKRTGTPLSEAEVLAVLDQVLDALAVVHTQGLYHLDLKPANIMMDEKGRALLIDFGASKQMSAKDGYSISTSTSLSFTPGFAPLEQTEQNMKAFGPWTDLYALGATLYKLLTGLTPPSASELLVSREPLTFPTPVSPRMQQLIAWMMKPAYVDRPQSVADVKKFLDVKPKDEETEVVVKPKQEPKPKPQPVVELKHEELPRKESYKQWWGIGAGVFAAVVTGIVVSSLLLKGSSTENTAEETEQTAIGGFDVKGNTDDADAQVLKAVEEVAQPEPKPAEDKIFDVVEQAPTFKKGDVRAWLAKNLQYPPVAAKNGISGLVVVGFVIERDGSISHVHVLRGADPSLDKEAVRVVKAMPKWNPGMQNGSPVRVKYNAPIQFKLQ